MELEDAERIDKERKLKRTTQPISERRPRAAVIGAGISGLICARTLLDQGIEVAIFEKSRGLGGRMATRRTAEGPTFDHGAQYFTVRGERFEQCVRSWKQNGIVAPWEGRIASLTNGDLECKQRTTHRFVGVPGMNAICRHLATDHDMQFRTRVGPPELDHGLWHLCDELGKHLGEYDCVLTSAPAQQSAALLAAAPDLQQQAHSAKMHGCWAVMLAFDASLGLPFDGAFVHESPLSWIARNDSKPKRDCAGESWVLHASPQWSGQYMDAEADTVLPKLISSFWQATGAQRRATSYAAGHKWRYAIPSEPLDNPCLYDPELRIGACGDWCGGPRVEGAFVSGMALAERVLASFDAFAQH